MNKNRTLATAAKAFAVDAAALGQLLIDRLKTEDPQMMVAVGAAVARGDHMALLMDFSDKGPGAIRWVTINGEQHMTEILAIASSMPVQH